MVLSIKIRHTILRDPILIDVINSLQLKFDVTFSRNKYSCDTTTDYFSSNNFNLHHNYWRRLINHPYDSSTFVSSSIMQPQLPPLYRTAAAFHTLANVKPQISAPYVCVTSNGELFFGAKRSKIALLPSTASLFSARFLFFRPLSSSNNFAKYQLILLNNFNRPTRLFSTKTMEQLFSTIKNKSKRQLTSDDQENSAITNPSKLLKNQLAIQTTTIKNLATKADKKVLKIIVEGNIGSGKTTFLSIFSKNCSKFVENPLIIPEPVDLWRDVAGVNIFQLLADDPKRWSFTFQSYVQLTMLRLHELSPDNGNIKVMERSIYSARYCFVENLLQNGSISDYEYFILDEWFKKCSSSVSVDLIIYLRTDPDIVFDRIHQRGRPEESKITLNYLRQLHDLHEDWLVTKKFPLPAPVITIDANTPLEKIMSIYEEKTGGILKDHQIISAQNN